MQPTKAVSSSNGTGHRVLVVEDEGLIAHDISRRLEQLGHTVVATVSTAEEAVAAAGDAEVVLMDIHIDGTRDGIDAANEIRSRHSLPVIFLTAHADRSTIERAKLAGPYGYIVKPLGPATLQASIEVAVYKHSLERQLQEREAWLRTTLAATGESIVAVDPRGKVLLMNAAAEAITGWTEVEAKGKPLHTVLPLTRGDGGKSVRDLESLAILEDAPLSLEDGLHLVSRTGRRAQIAGSVAPVRTDSATVGVVVSLHDVTAERLRERQIRQALRIEASGRLAAAVATDYTNLIAVIRNQATQLGAQFGEYSPARRAIEEVQQAAAAADEITRRLAYFGTRPAVQPEVTSLNGVIRKMSKTIESTAGATLGVSIQTGAGTGRILTDAPQLEQAIMSLVLHACAATPAGGTLELRTANIEAGTIAGRGCAFAGLTLRYSANESELERLFDPPESGERGWALAVAQSIVAEHGGLLSARALGDGTEVQMLLPVAEEISAVPPAALSTEPRTILLIESRERVRAHIHNVVEGAGFNLLEAADAAEATDLCEVRDQPVDLLIGTPADIAALETGIRAAARLPRKVLRIVERAATSDNEIQSPFAQQALLARVVALTREDVRVMEASSPGL